MGNPESTGVRKLDDLGKVGEGPLIVGRRAASRARIATAIADERKTVSKLA
jgi:hypothetical protein